MELTFKKKDYVSGTTNKKFTPNDCSLELKPQENGDIIAVVDGPYATLHCTIHKHSVWELLRAHEIFSALIPFSHPNMIYIRKLLAEEAGFDPRGEFGPKMIKEEFWYKLISSASKT